jgi:hypothetical protein
LPQPLDAPWKDATQYNSDFFNTLFQDASDAEAWRHRLLDSP